jgi:hypothetical protein
MNSCTRRRRGDKHAPAVGWTLFTLDFAAMRVRRGKDLHTKLMKNIESNHMQKPRIYPRNRAPPRCYEFANEFAPTCRVKSERAEH